MTHENRNKLGRGHTMMIAGVGACTWLAACGIDGKEPAPASRGGEATKPTRATPSGLETQTWVVNDTTGEVGRALAGYAASTVPAKAEQIRVWRAGGLRIVAVPAADLQTLRNSLSLTGPQQQLWNGELSKWTPILAGPAWNGDRELSVAAGPTLRQREPLTLPTGRLRLLARAYALPTIVDESLRSRLTIELVPQHEEPDGSARALQRQLRGGGDAEQRGMIFKRMTLEFVARPGECYLITADAPEMEWIADTERSSDSPGPEMTHEGRVDAPPTLGEAMLTSAADDGTLRARVILVLVPKTSDTYTLLAR
ncbi:MAG: hypothetical protein IT432_16885 [Phycisphaerales bacterium]|nr:hypothetical protein [Phycisphaerales bacterium]